METEVQDTLLDVLKNNEYMMLLGMEITELSIGHCKGRMKVSDRIKNPYGTLHGGSLYSLADVIGGTAACTYGYYVTTVSGSMNFMLPAAGTEYVYCEAVMVRQGNHLAVYDLSLTGDDGRVIDNASFTFFVTDNKIVK